MPAIMAMIAMTMIISTSVTPLFRGARRELLRFPANNVRIDALTPRLAVRSIRHDVRFVTMFSRESIDIRTAPGVIGNFHLQIRTCPLIHIGGRHAQRRQALLASGEDARIELVLSQRRSEIIDLDAGGR